MSNKFEAEILSKSKINTKNTPEKNCKDNPKNGSKKCYNYRDQYKKVSSMKSSAVLS